MKGLTRSISGAVLGAVTALASTMAGSAVAVLPNETPPLDTVASRRAITEVVVVDPASLPAGSRPRIPYLRINTNTIHDGAFSKVVNVPGRPGSLYKVRGGYLITSSSPGNELTLTVTFFPRHGRRLVLTQKAVAHNIVSVSSDGRRVAHVEPVEGSHPRIVVRRISDGTILGRRMAPVHMIGGFRHGRVLFNTGSATWWWRPGRWRLDEVVDADYLIDADLSAGQLLISPYCACKFRVIHVPRSAGDPWTYPAVDTSMIWSPDDLRILNMQGGAIDEQYGMWTRIRVLRASTGARRGHIFSGAFTRRRGVDPDPVWEDDQTFLVVALTPSNETGHRQRAVVRCHLDGTCLRITRLFDEVDVPVVLATASTS